MLKPTQKGHFNVGTYALTNLAPLPHWHTKSHKQEPLSPARRKRFQRRQWWVKKRKKKCGRRGEKKEKEKGKDQKETPPTIKKLIAEWTDVWIKKKKTEKTEKTKLFPNTLGHGYHTAFHSQAPGREGEREEGNLENYQYSAFTLPSITWFFLSWFHHWNLTHLYKEDTK